MEAYEVLYNYLKDKYDEFFIDAITYQIYSKDELMNEWENIKKKFPNRYENFTFEDFINANSAINGGCLEIGNIENVKNNENKILNNNKIDLSKLNNSKMNRIAKRLNGYKCKRY